MIDVINNYFLSRKLEDSIIPRNREIIAKSNLETLKIGLIVSFVVFSGAGIYYLFRNPMRGLPDFVFSGTLLIIFFLVRRLKNPNAVLVCLYVVFEYFCLFTMALSLVQPNALAVVGVCIDAEFHKIKTECFYFFKAFAFKAVADNSKFHNFQ